jgi:hypothetical protein
VRLGDVRIVGRPDGPDHGTLVDRGTPLNGNRAQVQERRRRAEQRLDRHRLAAGRDGARERHHPLSGRTHGCPNCRRDVDTAMLPGRVWMVVVEREAPHDLAVDRPGPGARGRGRERERAQEQDADSPHRFLLRCQNCERPPP